VKGLFLTRRHMAEGCSRVPKWAAVSNSARNYITPSPEPGRVIKSRRMRRAGRDM